MDVPRVTARLCRNMSHSVAADDIATQIVSLRERDLDLWPPGDIVGSVADLKGEVPDNPPVSLLTLVRVLTHATFVPLYKRNIQRLNKISLLLL